MKRNSSAQITKKEEFEAVANNRRYNRGSATVEMSIIISVVLFIFHLYIMIFLFNIRCANDMSVMVEVLYQQVEQRDNSDEKGFEIHTAGDKKTIDSCVVLWRLSKELELHRYNDSPVENIRRWQLATDTVLQGGDS